jgi:heptaprenyl diphosphate synthase
MFSNADLVVASAVLEWAQNYLATPNEQMRRTRSGGAEAICPFVKPSIDSNCFYVDIRREINGLSTEPIVEAMLKYRDTLRTLPPFDAAERHKKAIIAVFPEIPAKACGVLDLVHSQIKTAFVQEGLMVTQSYPGCDMRSVRNPELRAYESPYPLMALRLMAIHDILFVGENEEWFSAYHLRFGAQFRDPKTLQDYEQPLLEEYHRAKARFTR